ncbi:MULTISPECIES: DUF29 domain-containing protein [Arthrospira]|jgi:hypothetical protein|uniref:DUF29 domain-containing protein n=1 Tax=Limnospira platensis NIES-46 TaxID=1236695 RepID=A0A5M3TDT2_LIMPL|nr:DUF29 domain-containing protein [Arthrospira platensis]AMW27303.1 hypothetical protein AP285_04195 [Arthrospira platensis YZ]KDR59277.1 hypothetical protein APPUASWS_000060 [Arthrospira platensis str. Paraca]MBD2668549.1 DUF29 domain-containing protein [Arthrospira platensis FACHB-439]MBD2710229.1 DUF29 domain-containing protein [Arthrospira platensis FACHB-835]MDF2211163.1 DUF29 domain-containing protein [Arthrospira platensis NCB002]MDT9181689.1 DUF29 domain-containing protein [Limnospir
MKNSVKNQLQELYKTDGYLWLQQTVELLKEKDFQDLDLDGLIEELESLGRSEFNKARSLLRQIIIHLLLLEYWEKEYERNHRHWQAEIIAFRDDLIHELTASLKNKLILELDSIYHVAVSFVSKKTGLSKSLFPANCPYSFEELLEENWYPNHKRS